MAEQRTTAPVPIDATEETRAVFRDISRIVYACDHIDEVYDAVCSAAPRIVTGCDHASLTLLRDGKFVTAASTDDTARAIDAMEREIGNGPCVDAIKDEAAYIDADLTDGSPWPELASRVLAQTPVRGMSGFRLIVDEQKAGALNLFSDAPGRLTVESVNQSVLLASFVSVALMAATQRENARSLREGLQSNREIGMAVGLLMAFHEINDEEAFAILRRTSRDMNVRLSDIARQIVEHHNSRA